MKLANLQNLQHFHTQMCIRDRPSDVKLGVIVNTSDNILNTIDSLTETIMYAILFVVLVVFVFLGRWRATVIICITIPMSLIASFIYLAITDGGSLNIISVSYTHLDVYKRQLLR